MADGELSRQPEMAGSSQAVRAGGECQKGSNTKRNVN